MTEVTRTGRARCGALTADGEPCQQFEFTPGAGCCIWHGDPAVAQAARERGLATAAREKRTRPEALRPPDLEHSLQGIVEYSAWVVQALATGKIDKAVATGLSYGLQGLRAALTARDLERQLDDARAELATLRRQLRKVG